MTQAVSPGLVSSSGRSVIRILFGFLALITLVSPSQQALSQAGASSAESRADLESEPDLAGLLAATGAIRLTEVQPGLRIGVTDYPPYGLRIHVFDFAQDKFQMRVAAQSSTTGNFVSDFLDGTDDVFAINGGFFERSPRGNLSPSGLLILDGTVVAAEHDRAGSGVIYADRDRVGIAYRKTFEREPETTHALQTGPILVDPGGIKGIYKNVGGRFNRSAVCLREASFTVLVVEGGISLFQFADILSLPTSAGGFGCEIAINLDGGPSTQAVLRTGSTRMDMVGATTIQNALVISKRSGR